MSNLRVALFISRNKDNKHIEGFKERTVSFLTSRTEEELKEEFESFAMKGISGELSRLYVSVNTRNQEKIHKELLHYLIDNPDIKLQTIESKVASLASKPKMRDSKKFLLDCDVEKEELCTILNYLNEQSNVEVFEVYSTVNGYGIITSGFDTRELLKAHPDVELKRDGMKFVYSFKKHVFY